MIIVATGVGPHPNKLRLRYVGLPLLASNQCLSGIWHLCARSEYSCIGEGDSGGPLVVPRSTIDDTAVVIGIVSSSKGKDGVCGVSVFSKVTAELEWIKSHMG